MSQSPAYNPLRIDIELGKSSRKADFWFRASFWCSNKTEKFPSIRVLLKILREARSREFPIKKGILDYVYKTNGFGDNSIDRVVTNSMQSLMAPISY